MHEEITNDNYLFSDSGKSRYFSGTSSIPVQLVNPGTQYFRVHAVHC